MIIEVSGSPTVGQSHTLTCSTTTQPASLSFERLTLRNPFGSIIKSGVGQSLSHSFTSLQVSDSGEYGCDIVIVSSYTNRSLTVTKTHNVVVQSEFSSTFSIQRQNLRYQIVSTHYNLIVSSAQLQTVLPFV